MRHGHGQGTLPCLFHSFHNLEISEEKSEGNFYRSKRDKNPCILLILKRPIFGTRLFSTFQLRDLSIKK